MKKHISLAERWLWLGVIALAVAGMYSLIPVIGRTPQLKDLQIAQRLFDVALVVHVDLSVLLWFLSMLGMGLSLTMQRSGIAWPYWLTAGFWMSALATALITFSPLDAQWEVIKSNYVPVLHNGVFLLSLGVLISGLLLTLVPAVLSHRSHMRLRPLTSIEWGWLSAAWIVLLALAAFYFSAEQLPEGLSRHEYYESLFWAGGHILQFSFATIVMVAWLSLLEALERPLPPRRWVLITYALALFGAVVSFAGFLHPFESSEFTYYQTRVMITLGGLGPTLMAYLVIRSAFSHRLPRNAYASVLVMSLILFFAGEGLGMMIAGQNVTIPAHYHGVIVGITLALMGLAYTMLPRFGYDSVARNRLARAQPYVYGVGQLMHIGGLAYCGGYGILRKTAGGFEHLSADIKIALGIFGLGGLLAITGGLFFVVVMLKARKTPSA